MPSLHTALCRVKLDFYQNELPSQRALGLQWCVESNTFTFNICLRTRPFTRRGTLSVIGSYFDPLLGLCCAFHPEGRFCKIFAVLSLDGTLRFHLNITQAGRNILPMPQGLRPCSLQSVALLFRCSHLYMHDHPSSTY